MPGEPDAHPRMFVNSDVVEDGVDRLAGRDGGLDGVQEPDELTVPVALHAAAEHGARQDVEGRKQRRGAVTGIIVGRGGGMAGGKRTVGERPLRRLDLVFSSMDSTTAWAGGAM